MTIPPGRKVDVIIAGNKAGTATISSNDGGPCGVVSLDPYQSSGYAGEAPFLRPGSIPISAYCQEASADDPHGFIENIIRFNTTNPTALQHGHVSVNPIPNDGDVPAQETIPPAPATLPEGQYGQNEFWRYNPNQRMFFQTLLRHLAVVDFTCQCRMGAIPALVSFSGIYNVNQLYATEPLTNIVSAPINALTTWLYGFGFTGPNIRAAETQAYRPDHIRMACPILWVAKWACVAMLRLSNTTHSAPSGSYCATFNELATSLKSTYTYTTVDECDKIIYNNLVEASTGVTNTLTRDLQKMTLTLLMCYGEDNNLHGTPIIDNTNAFGTQNLTYTSEDCMPSDVTIKQWGRTVIPEETPTSPPPTTKPCIDNTFEPCGGGKGHCCEPEWMCAHAGCGGGESCYCSKR